MEAVIFMNISEFRIFFMNMPSVLWIFPNLFQIVRLKAGTVESFEKSGVNLESNLDFTKYEKWGEDEHLEDSKKSAEKVSENKKKCIWHFPNIMLHYSKSLTPFVDRGT